MSVPNGRPVTCTAQSAQFPIFLASKHECWASDPIMQPGCKTLRILGLRCACRQLQWLVSKQKQPHQVIKILTNEPVLEPAQASTIPTQTC